MTTAKPLTNEEIEEIRADIADAKMPRMPGLVARMIIRADEQAQLKDKRIDALRAELTEARRDERLNVQTVLAYEAGQADGASKERAAIRAEVESMSMPECPWTNCAALVRDIFRFIDSREGDDSNTGTGDRNERIR
jgi:hypothetical protein